MSDIHISTGNAKARTRSLITKGLIGLVTAGALIWAVPTGLEEFSQYRHARRVNKAITAGDTTKAVHTFDRYVSAGDLDPTDVAALTPRIEVFRAQVEQERKRKILLNLETAAQNFDYQTAMDIITSGRADSKFDEKEKAELELLAAKLNEEPTLYSAIVTAEESKIRDLTNTYVRQFPDGAHRDTVITQWLVLTYRNTEQRIATGDPGEILSATTELIRELERSWPSQPQRAELHSSKTTLRNTLDKRLADPVSPTEGFLPGTPVRIVGLSTGWDSEYLAQRNAGAPVGTIGKIDSRVSIEKNPKRVCVQVPTLKMTTNYDYQDCDKTTATDIALFENEEVERAYLTANERSRLRLLSEDLITAERAYFTRATSSAKAEQE